MDFRAVPARPQYSSNSQQTNHGQYNHDRFSQAESHNHQHAIKQSPNAAFFGIEDAVSFYE